MQNWELYRLYTFCRTVGAVRESPHHIRRLMRGERERLKYKIVNENASPSLCVVFAEGHVIDMCVQVNLDFNHVCDECAWIFWNELLRGLSNG